MIEFVPSIQKTYRPNFVRRTTGNNIWSFAAAGSVSNNFVGIRKDVQNVGGKLSWAKN
jgi:hypothetical protein